MEDEIDLCHPITRMNIGQWAYEAMMGANNEVHSIPHPRRVRNPVISDVRQ